MDGSADGTAEEPVNGASPAPNASTAPQPGPVSGDVVQPARIERPVPVMREWLIVIAPLIALAVGLLKMLVATDSGQFWAGVVTAAIGLVLVVVGVLVACRRIRSLRGGRD
jgi:hypothetical protein